MLVLSSQQVYCSPIERVIATVKAHGAPPAAPPPPRLLKTFKMKTSIQTITRAGVKAHFLDQRGFLNGTFGLACCGHPSIEVD